ncbi:unnamed protein product, partial [Discosporangium mesarthrocarpum]
SDSDRATEGSGRGDDDDDNNSDNNRDNIGNIDDSNRGVEARPSVGVGQGDTTTCGVQGGGPTYAGLVDGQALEGGGGGGECKGGGGEGDLPGPTSSTPCLPPPPPTPQPPHAQRGEDESIGLHGGDGDGDRLAFKEGISVVDHPMLGLVHSSSEPLDQLSLEELKRRVGAAVGSGRLRSLGVRPLTGAGAEGEGGDECAGVHGAAGGVSSRGGRDDSLTDKAAAGAGTEAGAGDVHGHR